MKRFALVILCLGLLGSTVACSSSSKSKKKDEEPKATSQPAEDEETKTAQELFIAANDKLDAGDFAAAAKIYEKALERDDSRVDIYVNKAIAEARAGTFDKAVLTIEDAIANGGKEDPLVYYTLGNIYHRQGMYGYAARAFRNSLAYGDDQNLDTLANLASSYMLLMEHDRAIETYQFMQELAPDDPRPYVGLGLAHQVRKQDDKALEFYDKAVAADPDYARAWYNRARLFMDMEEWEKAIADFERFLELSNDKKLSKRAKTNIDFAKNKMR